MSPYNGVPPEKTADMERCVEKVMRTGKSKSSAIAICHDSIVGKEVVMTQRKLGKRERRVVHTEAERRADLKDMGLPRTEEPEVEPPDISDPEPEAVEAKFAGAVTFAEVDTWQEGRDKADQEYELASIFHSLVDNILANETVKDKGDAIAKAAADFEKRVKAPPAEKGLIERLKEALFGDKAEITAASQNDLPDSAFAYIEPGGEKDEGGKTKPRSLRHYPIHDAAHVRNALARAAAEQNSGGKSGEIAKKALPKIRAAAEKLNIGKPAEGKKEEAETSFIVRKDVDGTYRWFGWVTNKWRDIDPRADPKHGGEILTEAAHKEFVAYLDANPDAAPELWAWHTPGTKHGQADWWDYTDGFLVMSGPLTEAVGKSFEGETEPLGMSHGFFALPPWRDTAKGLINKYRSFEASHLPLLRAANPWTDFETIRKEVAMFSPDKRQYLVKRFGEEVVAGLEADTKGRAALLEALGLESKAASETPVVPVIPAATPKVIPEATPQPGLVIEDPAETPVAPPVVPTAVPEGKDAATVAVEAALKALDIPGLNVFLKGMTDKIEAQAATITELMTQVTKVGKSADERVAAMILPAATSVIPLWSQRPSTSDETKLTESDEDKALKDAAPKASWVTQALGKIT